MTHEALFRIGQGFGFPDGELVLAGLNDFDGDGYDDYAIGHPYCSFAEPIDTESGETTIDVRTLDLSEAIATSSDGWCEFSSEYGRVVVCSGKTGAAVMGCWGDPKDFGDFFGGLGGRIVGVPDVTRDGRPDLLVGDEESAWLFAGPGGGSK